MTDFPISAAPSVPAQSSKDEMRRRSSEATQESQRNPFPSDKEQRQLDQLASFWRFQVKKDRSRYAEKMDRIRQEQEAPPKPPLYLDAAQQERHRLVFMYVDSLRAHEARVERQKAIHETRNLLQTVVLMEQR